MLPGKRVCRRGIRESVSLPFLRLFVQLVNDAKHAVARYHIPPGFSNPLHVYGVIQAGNVAKDVVSDQCKDEIAVQDAFGQLGIPYEVVRVHNRIGKAAVGVETEVGGQLHLPRQLKISVNARIDVHTVDALEMLTPASGTVPGRLELGAYPQLFVVALHTQWESHVVGANRAAFGNR